MPYRILWFKGYVCRYCLATVLAPLLVLPTPFLATSGVLQSYPENVQCHQLMLSSTILVLVA